MLLKFAIQEFIEDRKFKNMSKMTIREYEIFFKTFEEYAIEKGVIDLEEISSGFIKNFLMYCKNERGNSPTSINSKLKDLKALFNFLVEEEIISEKRNPTKKLQYVKAPVKIEVFTDEQIKQMLNYYKRLRTRDKSYYSIRDYTIIIFLLGSGARLGELINTKWRHVDLENNIITIYGKSREYSSIPLADKLRKELREYQIFCERYFEKLPEYLFTNKKGQPLTVDAIKNLFKRLKKVMNFKDVRLSCHTFRHTFAHRFLMAGGDVFTLQKMLRHSKLSMTEKYLSLWGVALKSQNEKFNPLNGIDL